MLSGTEPSVRRRLLRSARFQYYWGMVWLVFGSFVLATFLLMGGLDTARSLVVLVMLGLGAASLLLGRAQLRIVAAPA